MEMKDSNMSQDVPPPYTAGPQNSPGPPGPQGPPGPPPPQLTHTVITTQSVVPILLTQQMGAKPTHLVCKSCNQNIVTKVERKATTKTHLFALACLFICFPCVCLPYCMDSCKNADHYCPNCNAYIGTHVH